MKLGPVVTKLDKRNTKTLEKFDGDVKSVSCTSLLFFEFIFDFDLSGSRIPDAYL